MPDISFDAKVYIDTAVALLRIGRADFGRDGWQRRGRREAAASVDPPEFARWLQILREKPRGNVHQWRTRCTR
jgi:hypothetical protein